MTLRLIIVPAALALLTLPGCVAAVPMAMQLMSSPNATAQLCSMAKVPGQTGSFCDRLPFGTATQTPAAAQNGLKTNPAGSVNTAAR
jgi:hypothetical protein